MLLDILILISALLLIFNGIRNGAIFSLIHLLSIPVGIAVVFFFGPQLVAFLSSNGLAATPVIVYIALFLGAVLLLHILGTVIRGLIQSIPAAGVVDLLVGGALGLVESWLLWLFLLMLLGGFLLALQNKDPQLAALHLQTEDYLPWRDFYNRMLQGSYFVRINSLFLHTLPPMP
ncbi:colicin V production protein [Thermosporothrix hazakensis]|jgi:uncharacterized membrane protein required for colicin V production|uniref:Colicin V production protein n=2 Tax=Thermosporothrix TaxID=768650 RepID=A0A326U2E0_THEHA|nr:CvpA family protein [Thermosporothrix hazakensis]PZW22593.1 colicin V production protein [Thermosporothrix hazakensis]BBH90514.1 hypothetical protein KTC_52650 [Thermosporothrix sp. COM3]GCE48565.1 hypothetical protein KTH_34340 [Thermosporothrix hazakensis]